LSDVIKEGEKLIAGGNHHANCIRPHCDEMKEKLKKLQETAIMRKARLVVNSAFMQFV
jgi:hypothetical protein